MPTNSKTQLKTIVDFARRKGFVFPSSEIYGGFAATYDFGPLGVLLKKNIEQIWRYWNVTSRTDMVEIDGAIFMHPKVWEASGHIGGFSDLLVEDTVTKKRYRADHLVEDAGVKYGEHYEYTKLKAVATEIEAAFKQGRDKESTICLNNSTKQSEIFTDSSTFRYDTVCLIRHNQSQKYIKIDNHFLLKKGEGLYDYFKNKEIDKIPVVNGSFDLFYSIELKVGEKINFVVIEFEAFDLAFNELDFQWINTDSISNELIYTLDQLDIDIDAQSIVEKIPLPLRDLVITNAGPLSAQEIDKIIVHYNLKSPDGNPLSGAKQFNLMVKTHLGPVEDETSVVYLKGESCANIYLDWKAVQETTRRKLPFGIAQIGKAFRNEITVKQFMFRTREFEQMDVEYFVRPGTEDTHYTYFKQNRWDFYTQALSMNSENLRFRQHDKDELVFYAKEAWDVEYNFGENGFKELEGIHNRTDYDTKQHSKFSGQDLTYFDPEDNTRYLPYIIETSAGFTRMFLATMFEFYTEEELATEKGQVETRIVLKLPYNLAPFKLAILPLMKKDGLGEMAFELYAKLRKLGISVDYDESGSIGKRYRRQDENGTPFCATLDYDTKEKGTVTIRHRDSMSQEVIHLEEIEAFLGKAKSI